VASRNQIFSSLNPDSTVRALNVNPTTAPKNNLAGNDACQNSSTVELFNRLTNQLTDQYSVDLLYWRSGYDKEKDHPIFGEHSTARFDGPYAIKGMVTINSSSSFLESFGTYTDEDLDLYIAFDEWKKVFTNSVSPIADDRFELRYLYCDNQSPSGHRNLQFEVTSQGDGELNKIIFQQKYFWVIKAKRADFSWMPNEPQEQGSDDNFDGIHIGPIEGSGDTPTTETGKFTTDNNDIDTLANQDFDTRGKDDVFGGYR
jgi:hypothetical protein